MTRTGDHHTDRIPPVRATAAGDATFVAALGALGGSYLLLVVLMLAADIGFTTFADLRTALATPEIRFALFLSLGTSTISAVLCVWVATPIAYLMSRGLTVGPREAPRPAVRWLRSIADAVLDLPIVLPPLVVGVSLLILFRYAPFAWISDWVVYEAPAVVLAQFAVACAFAVRTMRATFDQIPERDERVAMTLGASRATAFWTVLMPQARPGLLTAGTMSWARSLGEFGPILIFASSTRMRTEVLPTTVYLEMQAGNLRGALAVSLLMIGLALAALVTTRLVGGTRGNAV